MFLLSNQEQIKLLLVIIFLFTIDKVVFFSPKVLKQLYQNLDEAGLDIFHPTIVQVLNPVFKSDDTILHWSKN